jgi:hypothetical protein
MKGTAGRGGAATSIRLGYFPNKNINKRRGKSLTGTPAA